MSNQSQQLSEMLDGCFRGDQNCQRHLYKHFHGYGLNIALRYSQDRPEALEILNDAFLKFFQKPERYNSEQAFKPWFRRVLIHTAIDHYRIRQKIPQHFELNAAADIYGEEMPMPMLSPNEDVLPLVQALPPMYRIVFNLYVMESYDHREIAALLNISESTSRSNLTRAKEKLREMLEPIPNQPIVNSFLNDKE